MRLVEVEFVDHLVQDQVIPSGLERVADRAGR